MRRLGLLSAAAVSLAASMLLVGSAASAQSTGCDGMCDSGPSCVAAAERAEDDATAACLLQVGCNYGDGEACMGIALAYARGRGVEQDMAAARLFFEESCYTGDVVGCGGLGVMYAEGLGGPALPSEAVEMLRPACEAAYGPACRTLGWLYEEGRGVPVDRYAAESLYEAGCDLDDSRSCDALEALRSSAATPTPEPATPVATVPDELARELRAAAPGSMDAATWATLPAGALVAGDGTRELRISRPLEVLQTEVTLGQWVEVMDTIPISALECSDPSCPVVGLSWWDALAMANALSARNGLNACYVMVDCDGAPGVDLSCASATFVGVACDGYRVPSFGEFSYMALGSLEASLTCEADDACVDRSEWHAINAGAALQPVGGLLASSRGLYDLLGNAREWVWDDGTNAAVGLDPITPFGDGAFTAGASFRSQRDDLYRDLRVTGPIAPGERIPDVGMRLVRTQADAACGEGLAVADTGGQCCWPGQGVRAGRCSGTPACPMGMLPSEGSCSAAAFMAAEADAEAERREQLRGGIFEREIAFGMGAGFAAFGWPGDRIESAPLPPGASSEFSDQLPFVSMDSHHRASVELVLLTRVWELAVGTRVRYGDLTGLRTARPALDANSTIRRIDRTWATLSTMTIRTGLRGLTWPRYRRGGYVIADPSFGFVFDATSDLELDGVIPGRRAYFLEIYLSNTMTFGPVFVTTRVHIPTASPGWVWESPVSAEFVFGGWFLRRIRGGE